MLSGARLEEEGRWREESVQWFARAVAVAPQNADALSTAGEGSLEYGKRSLRLYEIFGGAGQAGEVLAVSSSPLHREGTRTSGIARLQVKPGNDVIFVTFFAFWVDCVSRTTCVCSHSAWEAQTSLLRQCPFSQPLLSNQTFGEQAQNRVKQSRVTEKS